MSEDSISIKTKYDESGNIIEEAEFLGNERHGLTKIYSSSGKKIAELEFSFGKKDGKIVQWNEMGIKILEAFRINGSYHGEYSSWWDNGNLKEKGIYESGQRLNTYYWFKEDGTLLKAHDYNKEE